MREQTKYLSGEHPTRSPPTHPNALHILSNPPRTSLSNDFSAFTLGPPSTTILDRTDYATCSMNSRRYLNKSNSCLSKSATVRFFQSEYAIVRFASHTPLTIATELQSAQRRFEDVTGTKSVFSISVDAEEMSVVCAHSVFVEWVRTSYTSESHSLESPCVSRGWNMINVVWEVSKQNDDVLNMVSSPLSDAGISVFAISTFNTDYVMIKSQSVATAKRILKGCGHTIEEADANSTGSQTSTSRSDLASNDGWGSPASVPGNEAGRTSPWQSSLLMLDFSAPRVGTCRKVPPTATPRKSARAKLSFESSENMQNVGNSSLSPVPSEVAVKSVAPGCKNPSLWKTQMCWYFENGTCTRPKHKCMFAHGKDDLRKASPTISTSPLPKTRSRFFAPRLNK